MDHLSKQKYNLRFLEKQVLLKKSKCVVNTVIIEKKSKDNRILTKKNNPSKIKSDFRKLGLTNS